jgi:hypothetical protein
MKYKLYRSIIVLPFFFSLSGCGTYFSPLSPLTQFSNYSYITSYPNNAQCFFEASSGERISSDTPAFLDLTELPRPIKISCNYKGYWTSVLQLESSSTKTLSSRITNGEKITLVNSRYDKTDLGPHSKLPRHLHITLRRNSFKTTDSKNTYYAEELLYADTNWLTLIKEAEALCLMTKNTKPTTKISFFETSCNASNKKLGEFMRNDLMNIDQQRRRSKVE